MVKVTNTQDDNALQFDPCSETHARDWSYRAEGGAHFIFGYDGSAKGYVDRVLRIQKAVAASGPDETMRRVWVMDLLPKLLPRDLLLQSVLVELQEKWLKELMSTDMSKRPEERKGSMAGTASLTDSISGSTHGWIMDDLIARGKKEESVLCVEIKPKWGFLPDQQHVQPPEAAGIKSQIPRFHLHEHFRGNYTSEDVGYNPLDLFSGQQARMKKALEGLWLGWEASEGRKNNWRVYVDGQVVLPASVIKPIDVPTTGSKQSVRDSTIDLVLPCLISSNVFGLVGRLQSRLDATDISDLATRYGAEYPDAEPFAGSASSEATEAELRTLVARFVAASANPQPQSWSLRESLIAYSLAAIFKDCSIFVRIPLARKDGSWQVSANPSVKVVDVDLKPLCSMRKWYDLDEKLWKHWYE
ncbi:inositol-pentakisphosphate 2-kinase, partial [Kockovaella imperatae]